MPTPIVRIEYNRFPEVARQLRTQASQAVRTTAFELEADVKQQMASGPKTGEVYVKSVEVEERAASLAVTRKYHQASAPGEAPAVDTGNLINSIHTDAQPGALTATIHSDAEYAPHLEFGTVHMRPRPAWVPAAQRAQVRFTGRIQALLRGLGRG